MAKTSKKEKKKKGFIIEDYKETPDKEDSERSSAKFRVVTSNITYTCSGKWDGREFYITKSTPKLPKAFQEKIEDDIFQTIYKEGKKEPIKKKKVTVEKGPIKKEKVILGHFKPKFFMILGAVIVVIGLVAFYIFIGGKNSSSTYSPQCTNDSQCSQGSYCSSFGACLRLTCGDGICTSQERQSGSCPVDCGCAQGQVLNKYLNQCQTSVVLSQTIINNVVNSWLSHNAINGTITATSDSYYGGQTIKLVTVNCAPPKALFPCQMTFYINYQAQIVNVTSTN